MLRIIKTATANMGIWKDKMNKKNCSSVSHGLSKHQGPFLLTQIRVNLSMDK